MTDTTETMERRREEARSDRDQSEKLSGDTGEPSPGATTEHGEPAGRDTAPETDGDTSLLADEERRRLRARWNEVQAAFVDEPKRSVAEADELVRDATEALHDLFERDRKQLEGVWDRGDEVSTEDLRVTLQRYRSFFERLLTI